MSNLIAVPATAKRFTAVLTAKRRNSGIGGRSPPYGCQH